MKESGHVLAKKQAWTRRGARIKNGALVRECLMLLGGGFALSGTQLMGQALPLGACLVSALPMGLRSCCAALGAVVGYILRWEGVGMAESVALTVLMLAALAVFQGTALSSRRWFMPLLAAGVSAVLGSVSLFGGGEKTIAFWLMQAALAGAGSAVFRAGLHGSAGGRLLLFAAGLAGLTGLLPVVDLGLSGAVALSVASGELLPAAASGIALGLFGAISPAVTAALLLPAALCQLLHRKDSLTTGVAFLTLPNFVLLLCGVSSAGNLLAIALGAAAGITVRRFGRFAGHIPVGAQATAARALENAADTLELLQKQLPETSVPATVSEAESVYNGAAERVCRCCARFHRCWEHRARETYSALSGAARQMIERGVAAAEDFPPEFRNNCCHVEGFVTAINQELEGMLFRRRYRMQLRESRQIMAEEFGCMAEYLRAMGAQYPPLSVSEAAYVPEVGICSANKEGNRVSGDRGACFSGVRGDYFILLCDGMGTGPEAAELSAETVRMLERLLRSGFAPESALKILNGVELLRGSESFTTVDLLQVNLHNGESVLYKWGSAPSYWRDSERVRKIGTATPPPGVGVGGEHTPERYPLSLKRGEMLVLVSDGAGGTETECAVAAYSGESARELAALLISGLPAEDDMTAVAVSLHLCTS